MGDDIIIANFQIISLLQQMENIDSDCQLLDCHIEVCIVLIIVFPYSFSLKYDLKQVVIYQTLHKHIIIIINEIIWVKVLTHHS